jgi:phenylalanyl-tRNA synthetase beta chain
MRVPLSWLRDFTPVDLPVDELSTVLSELGLAVESVEHVGQGLDGVVVARVLEVGAIEGADRIRRVEVDAGGAEPVQVVCGAWNFEAGATVPLATVGAVLPGGFAIGRRKMKGVVSDGMLCAPDELGLPGSHDGILVLPDGLAPGTPFAEAMGIVPDVVFDLEVNANRPDAMSVAGVARDLAARLGLPFSIPAPPFDPTPLDGRASVVVEDPRCGRFVAQLITDVRIGPSPAWVASRLTLCGMRPINNVVDASNYVMLELGQPTHPYDLSRLPGRGLRVRAARDGETLVTLDGVERRFVPEDLLICDATDTAVGIAGIMGGASSEIDDGTSEVLLEAAWFDALSVARTSKRLNLRTEASARFEKGTDPDGTSLGAARVAELLGATSAGRVDVLGDLPDRPPVSLRVARVNSLLGTDLTEEQVAGYLRALGFDNRPSGAGVLVVDLPGWRPDCATEIDLVEEVARLHGYGAIPGTVPPSPQIGRLTDDQVDRRRLRDVLAGAGPSEAWTTTFVSARQLEQAGLDPAEAVRVTNPLDVDLPLLRTSLLPGLLAALAHNAARRNRDVDLFELGHVFRRPGADQQLPDEREVVAVALGTGDATAAVGVWQAVVDGLVLRDVRLEATSSPGLHPGRTARLLVGGAEVGLVGEVDPEAVEAAGLDGRVGWLQLDVAALFDVPHGPGVIAPVSRFPSSDVDLDFEVDEEVPAGDVEHTLRQAHPLVDGVRLFDVYRGDQVPPGRRSLTFRVRFQALDHTLTDDEVAAARRDLIAAVESTHAGARLRT